MVVVQGGGSATRLEEEQSRHVEESTEQKTEGGRQRVDGQRWRKRLSLRSFSEILPVRKKDIKLQMRTEPQVK